MICNHMKSANDFQNLGRNDIKLGHSQSNKILIKIKGKQSTLTRNDQNYDNPTGC